MGTGKTILMDIFYDSIPILEKKRVHFYSFMLQLYSSLNRWNLCCPSDELTFNLTPVESIASELAGEAWLLCFDEMQLTDFGSTRLLEGVFRKLLESGIVIVTTSNRWLPKVISEQRDDSHYHKQKLFLFRKVVKC